MILLGFLACKISTPAFAMNMTTPPCSISWKGYVPALLATAIWSGNFIVARGVTEDIAPVSLAFFRWLTASMILLPFSISKLIRQRREILTNLGHLVPTAFLGITVFNTLIYIAAHSTTALNLSLIAIFTPVFIILLARVFLKEPITPTRCLGVGLAMFGVMALLTGGDLSRLFEMSLNPGDAWMLLATLIFAAYTILVRRKPPELQPLTFLAATFLIGLILLAPWAAWEWSGEPPGLPPAHVLGSILYIGVGPALLSYLFWNRAIATIGPAKAGMIYYLIPFFCGLEAWFILGEAVTWVNVASGLLIISGIIVASREAA